jgi:predicted transcriptional regulator
MSDLKEENFVDEEEKFTNEKKISVKRKNLSVTFSPIVKIIRIESYKNYNKLIKKKNSN